MTRPRLVLSTVLLSTPLFALTIAGASVALPEIRTDLGSELAATQWVVNGYNVMMASFLVVTGSLADVIGRRRIFAMGLALFAVSCALSATAGDIAVLNAVRLLGGVGAAAAATGGAALLSAAFDGPARIRAFGMLGTLVGAGLAFGPSIGGFLIAVFGWRAVFAAPGALAALILLLVPALPRARAAEHRRVDWLGAALYTSAMVLLIYALVEGPERGFLDPLIAGGFAAAVLIAAAFAVVERRAAHPMLDVGLLTNRHFLSYCVAAGTLVTVLVPLLVYLPSWLISVAGVSPAGAGVRLLMLTLPTVLLPPVGAAIARRLSARTLAAGSVALSGTGSALLVTVGPHSGALGLLAPLLIIGTGAGLTMGVLDGLAIGTVGPELAGTASGMFNTSRLATETIAIAAVGALLASLSGGTLAGAGFTAALHTTGLALATVAAAATVCVLALTRPPRPR